MTEEWTESPRKRRRRSGIAMVAAGALLVSGPLVAGTAVTGALASEDSSSTDGAYVPPNPEEYGSIEVKSGKLDQVTVGEAGKIAFDATGAVKTAIAIQQLEVKGNGEYKIMDPAPDHLPKNINDLQPFTMPIEDGKAVFEGEVGDGDESTTKQYRWIGIMDNNRIPFKLKVTYKMDGKTYDDPKDMLGMSGEVEVTYNWETLGARPTTLVWKGPDGNLVSQKTDAYLPEVGVFKVPLPSNFTNVRPTTMDAGPDGYGGTLLAGTLVMFPPLGPTAIEVGFKANVEDFFMPTILCEFVMANTPDNASFAVIGDVLGALGTSLGGASTSLAGLGQPLGNLSGVLDQVSGLFSGLTDIQGVIKNVNSLLGKATGLLTNVNSGLANLVDNGGTVDDCDLEFTKAELGKLTGGGSPNIADDRFCSLTTIMTGLQGPALARIIEREKGYIAADVTDALGNVDLAAVLAPLTVNNGVVAGDTAPPKALGDLQPCAPALQWSDGTPPTAEDKGAPPKIPLVQQGVWLDDQIGTTPELLSLVKVWAASPEVSPVLQSIIAGALGVADAVAGEIVSSIAALYSVDASKYTIPCGNGAFGAVGRELVTQVVNTRAVKNILDATIAQAVNSLVTAVIGVVTGIQVGVNNIIGDVVTPLSTLTTGANSAIGRISTTVNSVLIGGLGNLLGGLATSLPALGTSLAETASTLNEEYALFQSFGFMAIYGGAQPYGPPWKPDEIPGWTIDPGTGAPVQNPPPAAGAVGGGTTEPVADSSSTPTPVPGTPTPDTTDPISQIDKRGYTAYQVDILGVGGERSAQWGLYGGAILLLLAGGIGGGLIAKARRQ